jgi:serine/threonine-protein kinase
LIGDMSDFPLQPGHVLAGKYRVERIVGTGAMGVVVAATHMVLDQRIALKFMTPGQLPSAEQLERFMREARAAVRLRSQHAARVLDVGTLDGGAPPVLLPQHLRNVARTLWKWGGSW